MRLLEDARQAWQTLEAYTTLPHLKDLIKADNGQASVVGSNRSTLWKAFLLFESADRSAWQGVLSDSRDAYVSLRSHFLRAIEHPDELESSADPLSDNEESPWAALRRDEALRAEILQDVERCMPENLYFRQPPTQRMLLDILFIFSKLNPDVGYRQGMHEILAPILWVVERDAIDPTSFPRTKLQDALLATTLDGRYIEHDTFTLFGLLMQNAKSFYETGSQRGASEATRKVAGSIPQYNSPIVDRCRRIIEHLLNSVDPALATHLKDIEIVPQVFLIRWIRLLFGREFPFDQVLQMWDLIFAEDSTLGIVDFVCVAMLLRIRWQLIDAGYDTALTLLLRYSEQPLQSPPCTLVADAIYLRDHLTAEGGRHIVMKYSGKPPPLIDMIDPRPVTPQAVIGGQNNHTRSPLGSPARFLQQSGGLEALLQEAARGVYTKGEEWGVNKALRDAVVEVRKNVEGFQSGRSPPAVRSRFNVPVRQPLAGQNQSESHLLRKIESLESRNKALAKMLEAAVARLWDHQKKLNDESPNSKSVEALSVAVAKVQMVQVFLEDSSIPLPTEESAVKPTQMSHHPPVEGENQTRPGDIGAEPSAQAGGTLTNSEPIVPSKPPKRPLATPLLAAPTNNASGDPSITPSTRPQRPPLAQSSFSWMLGQDPKPSKSFISPTPFPSEQRRRSQRDGKTSFLFGHENDKSSSKESSGRGERKGKGAKQEDPEEVFSLGTLKRGKGGVRKIP